MRTRAVNLQNGPKAPQNHHKSDPCDYAKTSEVIRYLCEEETEMLSNIKNLDTARCFLYIYTHIHYVKIN